MINNSRKKTQYGFGMALLLLLGLWMIPRTVRADTRSYIDYHAEPGFFYYPKMSSWNTKSLDLRVLETDRKIQKLRSDHPETAILKKKTDKSNKERPNMLWIQLKGPGTARLSFQLVKEKTVKTRPFYVEVVKYTNPFQCFKIGKKDLAGKFKKCNEAGFGYGKIEGKLDIRCNKGWKLVRIMQEEYFEDMHRGFVKNGSDFSYETGVNPEMVLSAYVLHEKSHRLLIANMHFGSFVDVIE